MIIIGAYLYRSTLEYPEIWRELYKDVKKGLSGCSRRQKRVEVIILMMAIQPPHKYGVDVRCPKCGLISVVAWWLVRNEKNNITCSRCRWN